jgi:hypothetical protein
MTSMSLKKISPAALTILPMDTISRVPAAPPLRNSSPCGPGSGFIRSASSRK